MQTYNFNLPILPSVIPQLSVGDKLLLSGELITARDAAHRRIVNALCNGIRLPFKLRDIALFYCGPSPRHLETCGAIGPTTSSRMDSIFPFD